jgi:hypothetical protein
MRRIFISYRRADSADAAGRLYDRLAEQFEASNVFMDVDDIRPGEDYVVAIERRIAGCDTMIVLVGPNWASATNEAGARRLDDPHDLARLEVETALRRNVRVIPILVGEAEMPEAADLPEPLRPLLRRQAVRLSHASFHKDVDLLLERLGRKVKRRAPRRWLWLAAGGAAAIVVLVAVGLVMDSGGSGGGEALHLTPVAIDDAGTTGDDDPDAVAADDADAPVRESEPPPPDPPHPTATVYVAYGGDPYGCLLNLQLTVDGRSFMLTANPFPVPGLAEGAADYQLTGDIQCAAIGACAAGGGGRIQVEDEATFNLVWQNVAVGQCSATLLAAY